jgi:hypothetical protein
MGAENPNAKNVGAVQYVNMGAKNTIAKNVGAVQYVNSYSMFTY